MNLEALRRKRVKRKGVKTTAHTGQRRIFFILDRATKKFHGDVGLWMQSLDYARKQRANKKFARILTDALRMHPTRPELWIYAAKYAMDVQADIGNARSYMQRGIRFCQKSKQIYIEYARLEMRYIAKLSKRRKLIEAGSKIDTIPAPKHDEGAGGDNLQADMIELPSVDTSEGFGSRSEGAVIDDAKLIELDSSPAMSGAIPSAIFDAAMKQFDSDPELGETFFNTFADFLDIPCARNLLSHVVLVLDSKHGTDPSVISCRGRLHVLGVAPGSLEFVAGVRALLQDLRQALKDIIEKQKLSVKVLDWLSPLAEDQSLGPELKQLLTGTEKKLQAVAAS